MKIDYMLNWAEYFTVLLMVVGFLIAITIDSMILNYIVIFVAGLMAGRLLYGRRNMHKFTHYLIVVGFLVGYMIGSYMGSRKVVASIFILSTILSYWLHSKRLIEKYMPVKDPHKQHW